MSKPHNVVSIASADPPLPDPDVFHLVLGSTRHVFDLRRGEHTRIGPAPVIPLAPSKRHAAPQKPLAISAPRSHAWKDRPNRSRGPTHPMHTFRIDPDNRITLLGAKQKRAPAAEGAAGACFRSQPELAQVVQNWPMTRLVAIWNGIEGVLPVRRFAHRQAAVSRIWKALQRKPQAPIAGPVEPHSKKGQVIALLATGEGATLRQLMSATGWQKHSVRGFLSGTLRKKMGLAVLSSRNGQGERTYRITP